MTHISITQGSIEPLVVDLVDRLENLTTLVGTTPQYDIYTHAGVAKVTNQTATVDSPDNLMRAICLVNTTTGGVWATGKYNLYLHFSNSPDTPRIGPIVFEVNP